MLDRELQQQPYKYYLTSSQDSAVQVEFLFGGPGSLCQLIATIASAHPLDALELIDDSRLQRGRQWQHSGRSALGIE